MCEPIWLPILPFLLHHVESAPPHYKVFLIFRSSTPNTLWPQQGLPTVSSLSVCVTGWGVEMAQPDLLKDK